MDSTYFLVAYPITHSLSSSGAGSTVQICQLETRPWQDTLSFGPISLQRAGSHSWSRKPTHSAETREGMAKCPGFGNINSSFQHSV